MMATIYVPRSTGGTLIIQYTPATVPTVTPAGAVGLGTMPLGAIAQGREPLGTISLGVIPSGTIKAG